MMASRDHQTLQGLVSLAANQHPERRAAIFDDGRDVTTVTYSEMQEAAGCVRRMLRSAECGEGEMVGLYYEPSLMVPCCILGILQADACFAPIDPRAPWDINKHFISSLHLRWVLLPQSIEQKFTQSYGQLFKARLMEDCSVLNDVSLRLVKLLANQTLHHQGQPPNVHLAYAMHTSGTTGQPKIVRVPHQCIIPNVTDLSNIFSITPDDIVFMASPLTFDPSIVEMFLALSQGASLLMVPDVIKLVPRRLLDILMRNQVSVLQATPTLISRFGRECLRQTLLSSATHLRVLAFGGEACPTLAQIDQMRAADNTTTRFFNLYGITEVSSWATCYEIDTQGRTEKSCESIPLGRPLLNTTLEVRNDAGQPITKGQGQLFIGGDTRVCLMDGETWPVPLDMGVIMRPSGDWVSITDRGLIFIGRHDDQIKRHGKKVSVSQVKQRIESLQVLEACEVILTPEAKLLLFCLPPVNQRIHQVPLPNSSPSSSSTNIDEDSLRGLLEDALPSHCIPDGIFFVEKLPLTLHGKVDVRALLQHATEVKDHKKGAWGCCSGQRIQRKDLALLWKRALSSSTEPLDGELFIQHGSGDSFRAVHLAEDVESLTGQSLPNLLDVILHKSFKTVLKHIQSSLTGKEVDHTDETSSAKLSQNGGVTATKSTAKLQHLSVSTDSPHESKTQAEPSLEADDSTTISMPFKETVQSDFSTQRGGQQEKSLHEHHSKRRKLMDKTEITQTDEMVDEILNRGVKNNSKFQPSFDQNQMASRTGQEEASITSDVFLPSALKQSCSCSVNRNHEVSNTHCDLCVSATVRDCHMSQNATRDRQNTTTYTYAIRRCSQLTRTPQRTAHNNSCNHLCEICKSSEQSENVVAVGNRTDAIHHGRSASLTLKQKWRYDTGKCVDASPLLVRESRSEAFIYIGSHSHRFVAISMATGKALWETELGDRVESSACLSACGSKVIVGCYDNNLYTLDAGSGSIQWKFETNGPIKSSPVADLNSSLVYVGSHDHCLYALDVEEQICKWHLHCGGGSVFSSPFVHYPSSTVYVATLAGNLLAVNKETGAKKWSFNCGKPVFSSPMVTEDGVLIGCVDGNLYCVSHGGIELWRFSTDAPVFSSPCVPLTMWPLSTSNMPQAVHPLTAGSCVVFGSHDHHVYCLSLERGELRWRHKMPAAVYASPFIFRSENICHDHLKGCMQCGEAKDHSEVCYTSIESSKASEHKKLKPYGPANRKTSTPFCDSASKHGCLDGLFVAVCSAEGTVATLDLASGEAIASCQLPGEVFSSPVVYGDCLLVGCRDDYVYCLEMS